MGKFMRVVVQTNDEKEQEVTLRIAAIDGVTPMDDGCAYVFVRSLPTKEGFHTVETYEAFTARLVEEGA